MKLFAGVDSSGRQYSGVGQMTKLRIGARMRYAIAAVQPAQWKGD